MVRRTVLYVAGQLEVGGAEQQLLLLLRQLGPTTIDPVVAVWDFAEDQPLVRRVRELGVPVHGVTGSSSGARLRSLCAIARRVGADYLHANVFFVNFPTEVAARAARARGAMGSIQSNYWREIADAGPVRGRLSAWRPATVIANSEAAARNAAADRSPLRPRRVWVVPNAVDTDAYVPASRVDADVDDRAGRTVRLVGVGRLVPEKRWPWLLAVLAGLDPAGPAWHLDICGEGSERPAIEAAVADLGLADRVTLLGHCDDVPARLAAGDLLVLGSQLEGTPNVVAEALSAGIPVLSTDVGDVDQLVDHGVEGFLVRPDDADAFRKHLGELLDDPRLRRTMGDRGRRRMVRERGPERLLDDTLRAYREAGWDVG